MKTDLIKLVSADKKNTLLKQFAGSRLLFSTYVKALELKVEQSRVATDSIDIYDSPNLLHVYADHSGYRRALKEVLDLLPD